MTRNRTWVLVGLACCGLLLGWSAAGCCGGSDEEGAGGSLTYRNQSPYFLHFLHPDEGRLYVAPGETVQVDVSGDGRVQVIVAPGQGVEGRFDAATWCCDGACGVVEVSWAGERIAGRRVDPTCPSGEGSCPFVFVVSAEAGAERLVAEALTGALNLGAQRDDTLELTGETGAPGRLEVQVAAVLSEDDHLDLAELWLVDLPAQVRPVVDGAGLPRSTMDAQAPRRAFDSQGNDLAAALRARDEQVWKAGLARSSGPGSGLTWIDLEFDPPDLPGPVALVVSGHNTQFIQDTYHAYMRRYGPGLPKLMRATSAWPSYRPVVERLLDDSGLGLRVQVQAGGRWIDQGRIGPIGPAGARTEALVLRDRAQGSGPLKVRLLSLVGAWRLDRVALAQVSDERPVVTKLSPVEARLWSAAGRDLAVDLGVLAAADGRRLVVAHGQRLKLRFEPPPVPDGSRRTVFLRLTGFYHELDRSPKPCIAFGRLFEDLRQPDAFAHFAARAWSERAWMERLASLAVMP